MRVHRDPWQARGYGGTPKTLAISHHIPSCVYSAVLNPCASGPCLNGGTCSSTHDHVSYHCACLPAFTGKDCGTGERTLETQEWGAGRAAAESSPGWVVPAWGRGPARVLWEPCMTHREML